AMIRARRILRSTLACVRSTAFECVQLGCVCNTTIMCIYMAHLPTFDVFPGHVLAAFYDLETVHKGVDFVVICLRT
ncbi:uncharacterized protein EV420DRAFT_1549123, partial [Desarmillaria tabescens]